jgi:hypothetical protein
MSAVVAAPQLAQVSARPTGPAGYGFGWRDFRVAVLLAGVIILNFTDLLYTLFADRIGMLDEMNPIAAVFLQTGLRPSLICFKLLMILCGAGMLWKLRHSRWAIPACWVLVIAYSGLSVLWYIWVRDVTISLEVPMAAP